jgi:hypothetical protein
MATNGTRITEVRLALEARAREHSSPGSFYALSFREARLSETGLPRITGVGSLVA